MVHFNSGDPDLDPFAVLPPETETVIVDPVDKEAAQARKTAVFGIAGGLSLVVKRRNHRKANSQMWWLGPHGQCLGTTTYALATDCGTVFARTAVQHLVRRMDREANLHAVTGFQRIMTSDMQGDGVLEPLHHPFHFFLRMVQRFEFEVRACSAGFLVPSVAQKRTL
jgi:cellulose synthase/poly-beta-1,6-N-acetylglucosamine synthase-like glycosyltransferase